MNESDFENELRMLRPASPSAGLETAIARELEQPRPSSSGIIPRPRESILRHLFSGLCWAGAGAAAVIAALSMDLIHLPASVVQPARQIASGALDKESVFEPAEFSRQFVRSEDGGLIYTADDEPTRVVRYDSMERHVWSNPSTGARVEVEVPREDVVLVPVAFQ